MHPASPTDPPTVPASALPPPEPRQIMEQILMAAVPEFVGALAAALVVAAVTWAWRRVRRKPPTQPPAS